MRNVKLGIGTGTFVRFWLVILAFIAVIGTAWVARGAIITVLVSFFLALVLNRPVSFIARHLPGKSRVIATLIAYVLVVSIIALVFFQVVPVFVKQISVFLGSLPDLLRSFQGQSGWLADFLNDHNLADQYALWLKEFQGEITNIAKGIGSSFMDILNALVNVIINVIFVAVLTFLMLIEGPTWEERFWRLVYNDDRKRKTHQAIAHKMYNVVSGYISGVSMVAAIAATLTAVAVAILSVIFAFELALIWPAWLIVFLLTFVPMFGSMIGGTIVALLLLLYSWPAAVIYAVFFVVQQQVENNIISPRIQSKRLNMSAMVVLIAVLFGLQVAGLLGALVSIPVAGCVMVLLKEHLRAKRVQQAKAAGREVDPNNEAEVAVVFNEKKSFTRLRLPRIKRKRNQG
ncbi:AI-2E family transporter [Candidatus Saccharibacteria bacterium]|nr:AI-2E family transporter [Candidatus Saccharibacteria bacterium]